MSETIERGTLWDFLTSILSQNSKKAKLGPSGEKFFPKKVSQCRKKIKTGTFGLVQHCMLRGETFSIPWANSGNLKFLELLVELF